MTHSTHMSMRAARLSCLFAAFRGRIGVTTVARSLALSVLMEPVNAHGNDAPRGRSFNHGPSLREIDRMPARLKQLFEDEWRGFVV